MSIINNAQNSILGTGNYILPNPTIGSGAAPTPAQLYTMAQDQDAVRRLSAQIERITAMLESGDFLLRKVRNGYRVIRINDSRSPVGHMYAGNPVPNPGFGDEYIAHDLTDVIDVIKLAEVNDRIDAAK